MVKTWPIDDFKVGFKEKNNNKLFDPSTLNCNSVVNKFTVFMKSVFIFG